MKNICWILEISRQNFNNISNRNIHIFLENKIFIALLNIIKTIQTIITNLIVNFSIKIDSKIIFHFPNLDCGNKSRNVYSRVKRYWNIGKSKIERNPQFLETLPRELIFEISVLDLDTSGGSF